MRGGRWRKAGRLFVALAAGAYALPSGGFVTSGLVHHGSHLVMEIERQQAKATALGLTHSPDFLSFVRPRSAGGTDLVIDEPTYVHSHGGSEHGHGLRIGRELSAPTPDHDNQDATFVLATVTAHLPAETPSATMMPAWQHDRVYGISFAQRGAGRRLPPLPPPRS